MSVDDKQVKQDDSRIILTSIYDIKAFFHFNKNITTYGEIHCVVKNGRFLGKVVFFDVYDGTEFIQVIAEKKNFSEEDWHKILSLKKHNRMYITALVGLSKTGELSLILDTIPLSTLELQLEVSYTESHISHTNSQIFLSRLRAKASTYFCDRNYLEFEPYFLSSSWDVSGLQPLRVEYPGFGTPLYLAPSPSPQLLRALIITGRSKVFCVARCFTTTYRDANANYESLMLCVKEVGVSFEKIIDIAVDAISYTFGEVSLQSDTSLVDSSWKKKEYTWPPLSSCLLVSKPEIQIFREFAPLPKFSQRKELQIFRLCWPPNVILAEGAIETLEGEITFGSLTLHLESMLLFMGKDSSLCGKRRSK